MEYVISKKLIVKIFEGNVYDLLINDYDAEIPKPIMNDIYSKVDKALENYIHIEKYVNKPSRDKYKLISIGRVDNFHYHKSINDPNDVVLEFSCYYELCLSKCETHIALLNVEIQNGKINTINIVPNTEYNYYLPIYKMGKKIKAVDTESYAIKFYKD